MRFIPLVLLGLVATTPALAQSFSPVGQWHCNRVSQSNVGNAAQNWVYDFTLLALPDSSFSANGTYGDQFSGRQVQFIARGSWRFTEGALVFQGPMRRSDGLGGSFFAGFDRLQAATMFNEFRAQTNVVRSSCQRTR